MDNDGILRLHDDLAKRAENFRNNFWQTLYDEKMAELFAEFTTTPNATLDDVATLKLKAELLNELDGDIKIMIENGKLANHHLTHHNEDD
jgi:FKBP-type peptidyl-prolyl cis-trans isomerase (trigger factor)